MGMVLAAATSAGSVREGLRWAHRRPALWKHNRAGQTGRKKEKKGQRNRREGERRDTWLRVD
jgi:hypothetical protein